MALKRWMAALVLTALVIWCGGMGDGARACGPFVDTLILVNAVYPADAAAYARGELGIVRPSYARWYLVQAYRRFLGRAAAGPDPAPPASGTPQVGRPFENSGASAENQTAIADWLKARDSVLHPAQPTPPFQFTTFRWATGPSQASFENCGLDSVANAVRTLRARAQRFGADSPIMRVWVVAQEAVFANCDGRHPLTLPEPAPARSDPIVTADRAYQTAAAYFYATEYEKAEGLFRAIGADPASPWQPFGRYLAVRALLRRATVSTSDAAAANALLVRADEELQTIIADASLAQVHTSAGGLRNWIAAHLRPGDRLHTVATRLASSVNVTAQDFVDYTRLMDRLVDEDVKYPYEGVKDRGALVGDDDLTDWILAMQGEGAAGQARAVSRWKDTHTLPWLVAALWRVGPGDSDADAVLSSSTAVDRGSPAFATVSFLRARLLIARKEPAAARTLLDALPDAPSGAFPADAINLLRAERFRLATSLDELLRAAPRVPVAAGMSFSAVNEDAVRPLAEPTFDIDAAITFTEHLPLSALVDVVRSDRLPARLKLKVANEAWTRAVQFRDDDAGLAVASILKTLAPALAQEMDRYLSATSADTRHVSGVLTLLRWPGLRNYVPLSEETGLYRSHEPRADIALDAIGLNWWCGVAPRTYREAGPYDWFKERPITALSDLAGFATKPAAPAFLSAAERAAAASEWKRLADLGSAPTYLAAEAVKWAQTRPQDAEVAEALARAVRATHFGCGDDATGTFSQRAFALLHRLYPNTSWAKQTPYWYEGR